MVLLQLISERLFPSPMAGMGFERALEAWVAEPIDSIRKDWPRNDISEPNVRYAVLGPERPFDARRPQTIDSIIAA